MNGIFITGSDTNVGKTWVGKHLIKTLITHGVDVFPCKPVESGWSENNTQTDAWILANAANKTDQLDSICPNRYKNPVSPVRAAAIEGERIFLEDLVQHCLAMEKNNQFLFVEGAGGFYSPLCVDGLNADLASALGLPVLLIVENRLGCINQTLLNVEAIQNRGLELKAVILNDIFSSEIKNSMMDNLADLKSLINCPILGIKNDKEIKVFKKISRLISN